MPLIPATLEQMRKATQFAKLDLHSAYNLIRIHEGDERKLLLDCFFLPYGQMPPDVFQSFMNVTFWNCL